MTDNRDYENDLKLAKLELSNLQSVLKSITDKNKTFIIENENLIINQFNGDVLLFLNKSNIELSELNKAINQFQFVTRKNKTLTYNLNSSEFKEKLINEILVKRQVLVGTTDCLATRESQLAQCSSNFFGGAINSLITQGVTYGIDYYIAYLQQQAAAGAAPSIPFFTIGASITITIQSIMNYYSCEQEADDNYIKCKKIKR
ncbi:hypothetical protein [Aquirufa nivalisilvae]|nr:hypothetical protein [Aquirufa nivalisilvae]